MRRFHIMQATKQGGVFKEAKLEITEKLSWADVKGKGKGVIAENSKLKLNEGTLRKFLFRDFIKRGLHCLQSVNLPMELRRMSRMQQKNISKGHLIRLRCA